MKTIIKKIRNWTLAICGTIAAIALLISNIDSISLAIGIKHYKAPLVANYFLIPQGAFAAAYGTTNNLSSNLDLYAFPSTNNPFFNDPRCFSVPVFSFMLTNPNDIDMMVSDIYLDTMLITTQMVSVGMGPMIAGADFMIYECILSTNGTRFTAQFKGDNSDYLKLSPGELAAVRIYIRSSTSGLYRIRPICKYSVGRQSAEMVINEYSDPIYFFDLEPKPDQY